MLQKEPGKECYRTEWGKKRYGTERLIFSAFAQGPFNRCLIAVYIPFSLNRHLISRGSRIIERGFQESRACHHSKNLLRDHAPLVSNQACFCSFYACTQFIINYTKYMATAYALGAFDKKIVLVSPFCTVLEVCCTLLCWFPSMLLSQDGEVSNSLSWLKLRSLSQLVMGIVSARCSFSSTQMLGKVNLSLAKNASTSFLGTFW